MIGVSRGRSHVHLSLTSGGRHRAFRATDGSAVQPMLWSWGDQRLALVIRRGPGIDRADQVAQLARNIGIVGCMSDDRPYERPQLLTQRPFPDPVTAIPGNTSDPGSLQTLKAVVETKPDAILVADLEAECASTAGGRRARGCDAILLGADAVKPTHALRTLGFLAPCLANSATDAIRQAPELHRRLIERRGAHDSVYAIETYARHIAAWVATHPNATRRAVWAAIRIPFHGLVGPYAFDADTERRAATTGVCRNEVGGLQFLVTARDILRS